MRTDQTLIPGKPSLLNRNISDVVVDMNMDWDDDSLEEEELDTVVADPKSMFKCTYNATGVTALQFRPAARKALLSTFDQTRPGSTQSARGAKHGSVFTWMPGDMIGMGSLGKVFQGLDQKSGQIIAVKEMNFDITVKNGEEFKESLVNEVNVLKELVHPNIVSFLGTDTITGTFYVYLEYMPGGSIAGVLAEFGPLDESLMCPFTVNILDGIHYLHNLDPPILHRDIKCSNILVALDCQVKIADFGCSKSSMQTLSKSIFGSIPWMAPEVINASGYGRKADIWSFGCVLIEMATASSPWGKFDNKMAAMAKIGLSNATPPVPAALTQDCQNFIRKCVQRDKVRRPQSGELMKEPFVASSYGNDLELQDLD